MSDYGRQRDATAEIGKCLAENGWSLLGYSRDQSDIMTDYYCPAYWDGIAHKDGFTLLVDVGGYQMGKWSKPQDVYGQQDGPCCTCQGTGKERVSLPSAVIWEGISGKAVHHTEAITKGDPCSWCKGTGQRIEQRIVGTNPAISYVQKCPGRWMLFNASGKVLATGQRPLAAARDSEVAKKVVEIILNKCKNGDNSTKKLSDPQEITVRASELKEGFVEVLFPDKPELSILDELKASGFRWSGKNRLWYGPETRLPAGLR